VRHGILAAALLAVALLRALSGDWLWASVLGLGAAAELGVTVLERRRATPPAAPAAGRSGPPVEAAVLDRSLHAHRQGHRMWTVVLGLGLVVAAALLVSAPALALTVGLLSLVPLAMLRRERRTLQGLALIRERHALVAGPAPGRSTP
jgi:hypothetical protein